MSILLSAEDIHKTIGARTLFEGVSLKIQDRECIGLIGPNGAGKSTLLKILSGLDEGQGEISLRKGVKTVYLPQVEEISSDLTVLQAALQASEEDVEELYEREVNASIELGKIGFEDVNVKVGDLSGGWLKRLCIARQLARNPDLLFLDEPTNHMDVEGIEWLEDTLAKANYSFVLISHDRIFLEKVTNRVVELNEIFDDYLLSFNCAYEEFMRRRVEFLEAEKARYESLANKNRREQDWVKAGVQARGTKQKARLNEAFELKQEVSKLKKQTSEAPKVLIDFQQTERKTKRLAVAHNITKAFGHKKIVNNLSFTLTPGMRIGLLGLNGVGKTTLMKMIAGEIETDSGGVELVTGCKVLHFDQTRQLMDENEKLRHALSPSGADMVDYRGKQMHIASWARKLKFRSDQLDSPVSALSGGERARVIMGRLMLQTADILLLDEPTNDLDIPAIEVLEESLMTYPGALVLVTHDRALLDRISTTLLALDGQGGVMEYASYNQWKQAQNSNEVSAKESEKFVEVKKSTKKPTKLSYNEQREWDSMEESILSAETALEILQENPVDATDDEAFTAYCEELGKAQQKVDDLYGRWSELEAKLSSFHS